MVGCGRWSWSARRGVAAACRGVRGGQAGEDALAVMVDRAGFAVLQFGGANNAGSKGGSDGLVAEADAEDGRATGHALDERDEDAGILWRAGTG